MKRRTPPIATVVIEKAAHEALVESAVQGRKIDALRAKAFAKVDGSNHFVSLNCVSVGEYGLRIGYGSRQAREYAAAGRVMNLCPLAEEMLLEGQVCVSTLAILEPFFVDPELRPLDEEGEPDSPQPMSFEAILEWARLLPDFELRKTVNRRKAEVRTDAPIHTRTLHFTNRGAEDLDRTQVLLTRSKKGSVTQSEAAEKALRYFVEKHDLLEKTPGKRRLPLMPPRTDGSKNPRSVPAEVRRALMAEHGDVCAIEFCEHRIWLENAHHLAHALGGGNELADQDHICTGHHGMKDSGQIVWVPDSREPGGGYYRSREGAILHLKPPVAPRATPREPPRESLGGSSGGDPPDRVQEGSLPLIASRGYRIGNVRTSSARVGSARVGSARVGSIRGGSIRGGSIRGGSIRGGSVPRSTARRADVWRGDVWQGRYRPLDSRSREARRRSTLGMGATSSS